VPTATGSYTFNDWLSVDSLNDVIKISRGDLIAEESIRFSLRNFRAPVWDLPGGGMIH
jgi:hypothetical protein